MRLVPATSASSTRETEKKRPAKTALPPWRAKSRSTTPFQDELPFRLVAHPVADLVAYDGPEDAEDYGPTETEMALLTQDSRGKENGRAREGNIHSPEHDAEKDNQVAEILDEWVELVHGVRRIVTSSAFEGFVIPRIGRRG